MIFNQVPPFVGLYIELCWKLPIGFWWYDRGNVTCQKVIAQPIGIEDAVRQQGPGKQAAFQRTLLAKIMGLAGHQSEFDAVAERVRQRQYLRRYAAARASNGQAQSPPFAP